MGDHSVLLGIRVETLAQSCSLFFRMKFELCGWCLVGNFFKLTLTKMFEGDWTSSGECVCETVASACDGRQFLEVILINKLTHHKSSLRDGDMFFLRKNCFRASLQMMSSLRLLWVVTMSSCTCPRASVVYTCARDRK